MGPLFSVLGRMGKAVTSLFERKPQSQAAKDSEKKLAPKSALRQKSSPLLDEEKSTEQGEQQTKDQNPEANGHTSDETLTERTAGEHKVEAGGEGRGRTSGTGGHVWEETQEASIARANWERMEIQTP